MNIPEIEKDIRDESPSGVNADITNGEILSMIEALREAKYYVEVFKYFPCKCFKDCHCNDEQQRLLAKLESWGI